MQVRHAARWPSVFVVFLLLNVLPTGCSDISSSGDLAELDHWVADLDLRVGSVDDPDYSLTWFRTLAVSESGRIYTVHGQEQLVRVFEPDGTLSKTIGGRGDGPGEFQNVGAIGWVADTLWVLDFSLYRFNLFSEDGEFIYSFAVPFGIGENPDQPQPPRAYGLLWDGSVHGAPPAFSRQIEDGTITHHHVLLMSREGEVTDSIASIPFGNSQWAVYDPDQPRSGMLFGRQPYGDGPLWGFLPRERAIAILDRTAPQRPEDAQFRLLKLSLSGDTIFSREYPYLPVQLTKEVTDSTLDAQVNQWVGYNVMGGVTAARLRAWAERELYTPPYWPPITQMVIGMDGGYWLRGRPDGGGTVEWYVLDSSGVPQGRVDLPAGFQILQAKSNTVWGSETDDLDVPYLLRFSIDRGDR